MNCAMLITTCDAYKDLWTPFLKLVCLYWPDIPFKVYINAEKENLDNVELNQFPFEVEVLHYNKNHYWGQRMIAALDSIKEDYVFLVVDDFFLQNTVPTDIIRMLLNKMEEDTSIASIQLKASRILQEGKEVLTASDDFIFADLGEKDWATHFIPTIWRKTTLRKWLRKHETVWGFEVYGTQRYRRWKYKERVLILKSPVVYDYLWVNSCSAVINGKWLDDQAIDLFFKNNNINIDFNSRGRISVEEYRSRTLAYTLKKLTWKEILKKTFLRVVSYF